MTKEQIKCAKIGDRVKFIPLEHDAGEYSEGTITHKLTNHVEITWDDGEIMSYEGRDGSRVFPKK